MGRDEGDLEAALAELRLSFVEKLREYAPLLAACWQGLQTASTLAEAREAFEAIGEIAHKLSGSAAVFGQPAVGAAAKPLELACLRQRNDEDQIPDADTTAHFHSLMAAIDTALTANGAAGA